jgi:hypothetical protein
MPPKKTPENPASKLKYKTVPAALRQVHLDDLDEIGKAEDMSRSELIRRAVEAFIFNYKTDNLDQKQIRLEKRMDEMNAGLRNLVAKAIKVNAQVLYFQTLPYLQGMPKQRLTPKAFQTIFDKSAQFGTQVLATKTGKLPDMLSEQIFPEGESEE